MGGSSLHVQICMKVQLTAGNNRNISSGNLYDNIPINIHRVTKEESLLILVNYYHVYL